MNDLNYEETIEDLDYAKQYYQAEVEELQNEIKELNEAVDDLLMENNDLFVEAQNARRSFTGLQIATSMLLFVYGMLYGLYLCPK